MNSTKLGGGSWTCEKCKKTIQGTSIHHECVPSKITTQRISMNKIDAQYQALLQDILDNGVQKMDRTSTGTISVFGRQIRHRMADGFPLLTTKKMAWKTMVTELLWFLRGDTNIKYLVDNGCHIWDGDAYKNYVKKSSEEHVIETHKDVKDGFIHPELITQVILSKEEFIERIKTDGEFAKKWGELGPLYGKQWRKWAQYSVSEITFGTGSYTAFRHEIDQIANLIKDLKTTPDSRRLMVSAWNVGEIDSMVLPPCHYGFQVYTRELSEVERFEKWWVEYFKMPVDYFHSSYAMDIWEKEHSKSFPKRAISLMWNQRSVDTFLGLPFNIASYALLLEIIAKEVNMIPDELIGNLGDVHLYSNHIEQAKEQIGREPMELPTLKFDGWLGAMTDGQIREEGFLNLIQTKILPSHFEIENYKSHLAIKAPLSN